MTLADPDNSPKTQMRTGLWPLATSRPHTAAPSPLRPLNQGSTTPKPRRDEEGPSGGTTDDDDRQTKIGVDRLTRTPGGSQHQNRHEHKPPSRGSLHGAAGVLCVSEPTLCWPSVSPRGAAAGLQRGKSGLGVFVWVFPPWFL